MAESNGIGKVRLEKAMDRLFRITRIERAELWKGADRKAVHGLRETAGNGLRATQETAEIRAGNGAVDTVRETRETVQKSAGILAGDAGNTHTTPKGVTGAALRPPAPAFNGSHDLTHVAFPADADEGDFDPFDHAPASGGLA